MQVHELSVAREIIRIVESEMARLNLRKIETVNVRVGALSGIHPEALSFGYEASVIDTPLDGSRLVIETVAVKGRCRACAREFEVEEFVFLCPHCHATDLEVIAGEELDIDHIVGE